MDLLGASRSLDDLSGKRAGITLEALAKSQKPARYDPALSFLLGASGIQLETVPESALPASAGFVATIYIVSNSLLREPGQASLKRIYSVSPQGYESFCRAMSKRRVLQVERSATLCLSTERTKGDASETEILQKLSKVGLCNAGIKWSAYSDCLPKGEVLTPKCS